MSRTFLSNDADHKPMRSEDDEETDVYILSLHTCIFPVSPLIKGHSPSYEQI